MLKPRKLIWQIFPANVITILCAVIVVAWYGATALQEFYLQDTEEDLKARGVLLATQVSRFLREGDKDGLRRYCVQAGRYSRTRITIVDETGTVIADSSEEPGRMDNHRMRVEIRQAIEGMVGVSRRFSKTLGENLIYVAIPLYGERFEPFSQDAGGVQVVLRTSVSVASLDRTLRDIRVKIGFAALGVVLVAGLVTLLICRNISRPLEQMTLSAKQFSSGNFKKRMLPVAGKGASREIMTLAASMDRMAALLDEKIQAIVTHRNQLETVFSSMVEAVIATDLDEKVISINSAAADLFEVDKDTAPGKLVQQVVRNVKLQQEISRTITTKVSKESEIVFHYGGGERFLHTHVVILANGVGEHVGALVVMNDVTRLRQLENIRRDFVANVSHELKTPITSIQGYVETLLDGAVDDREDTLRFLQIVLRQSERLTAIIDDLLALSRIEEDSRKGEISLGRGPLIMVLKEAVQTCQLNAEQAGIAIRIDCPDDIVVKMNATLLEQAIVNLLINSIRYSKSGTEVVIRVDEPEDNRGKKVRISVIDQGCGIAREHLPRLFERFYRSDKARSRSMGGTGLGLAIVKHIAQAHAGTVTVESVEGEWTTFSITLPAV
jgi:two-component system phosphate regulon sensor histidine kinase PhoR